MSDGLQIMMWGDTLENIQKKHNDRMKRNWENAFQRWSDQSAFGDGTTSDGVCGYGAMCDYCEDNSYGRPCVRALNEWCRAKRKTIDYTNRDFEKVWRGEV